MTPLDTTEVPIGTLLGTEEPATWALTSTNKTHNGLIIAPRGAGTTTLMGHLTNAAGAPIHHVYAYDGAADTLLATIEREITNRRHRSTTDLMLVLIEHAEDTLADHSDRWARIAATGPEVGISLIAHVHRINRPRSPRGLLGQLMRTNLTILRGRGPVDLAHGRWLPSTPDWTPVPQRPGCGIHYQHGVPRPVRIAYA